MAGPKSHQAPDEVVSVCGPYISPSAITCCVRLISLLIHRATVVKSRNCATTISNLLIHIHASSPLRRLLWGRPLLDPRSRAGMRDFRSTPFQQAQYPRLRSSQSRFRSDTHRFHCYPFTHSIRRKLLVQFDPSLGNPPLRQNTPKRPFHRSSRMPTKGDRRGSRVLPSL